MKVPILLAGIAAGLLSGSVAPILIAADEPVRPPDAPARGESGVKPGKPKTAESESRIREPRERRGPVASPRQEWARFREEIKDLPPEQRAAKVKEWRAKHEPSGAPVREEWRHATPEQRAACMKEWRERLEKRVGGLRQKQKAGALTEEEKRQLESMEQMIQRLDEHKRRIESANAPLPKPAPAGTAAGEEK